MKSHLKGKWIVTLCNKHILLPACCPWTTTNTAPSQPSYAFANVFALLTHTDGLTSVAVRYLETFKKKSILKSKKSIESRELNHKPPNQWATFLLY